MELVFSIEIFTLCDSRSHVHLSYVVSRVKNTTTALGLLYSQLPLYPSKKVVQSVSISSTATTIPHRRVCFYHSNKKTKQTSEPLDETAEHSVTPRSSSKKPAVPLTTPHSPVPPVYKCTTNEHLRFRRCACRSGRRKRTT